MTPSDPTNPYQSAANENPIGDNRGMDQESVESWLSLGRWQTFLSILGFLASFCLFAFVAFTVLFGMGGGRGRPVGGEAFFTLLVFLPMAVLVYLIPSVLLFKAGKQARDIASGETKSLVQVVQSQRSFWRYLGVLAIILLGFYAVAIGVAILSAMRF